MTNEMVSANTKSGPVMGQRSSGIAKFLGIPFAAPPVGDLRFEAPQPVSPWVEPRQCVEFSGVAPQDSSTMEMLLGGDKDPQSEDCLYLNVFTPAADDVKRPVMVWIHGGAFTIGSARTPWYHGGNLATRGDVVVVTINYRLGALGFLHLPSQPTSGNNGILDQIAALEWVQANITNFGGDPANVTIFGESAGAMSVGTLMAIGRPGELFHKAILQSGAGHHVRTPEFANAVTTGVCDGIGIDATDITALRNVSVADLLAAQSAVEGKMTGDAGLPFSPVVDGIVLAHRPIDAIAAGSAKEIPVLTGTNLDEMKLFVVGAPAAWGDPDATLTKRFGADMVRLYVEMDPDRAPLDRGVAMVSDFTFGIPAVRLLDAQINAGAPPCYRYRFDYKSTAFGGLLGACHALELPFVFDNMDSPGARAFAGEADGQDELAGLMAQAWVTFARTGNPNCDGLPEWHAYTHETLETLTFDNSQRAIVIDFDAAERRAWDGLR